MVILKSFCQRSVAPFSATTHNCLSLENYVVNRVYIMLTLLSVYYKYTDSRTLLHCSSATSKNISEASYQGASRFHFLTLPFLINRLHLTCTQPDCCTWLNIQAFYLSKIIKTGAIYKKRNQKLVKITLPQSSWARWTTIICHTILSRMPLMGSICRHAYCLTKQANFSGKYIRITCSIWEQVILYRCNNMHTIRQESQLSTGYFCIMIGPKIITYWSPFTIIAMYFNQARRFITMNKTNSRTCVTS